MPTHDSPRRRFVIHVFAGLAAASTTTSACNRESTNAGSQPANAPVTNQPNAVASADAHGAMPIDPSTPTPAIAAAAATDASTANDASAATASPDASGANAPATALGATDGGGLAGTGGQAGVGGGGRMGGGGAAIEGTIGLGSLGTMSGGSGRMGQGYGYGRSVLGRHASTGPLVRTATPTVTGSLSSEVIRRVVLRNLGQVTHCYEMGLAQNPSLEGRVIIEFVIGPSGAVATSNVAATTVANPAVGLCIANAARRWQFPSPEGGGVVRVAYPFNLQHPE